MENNVEIVFVERSKPKITFEDIRIGDPFIIEDHNEYVWMKTSHVDCICLNDGEFGKFSNNDGEFGKFSNKEKIIPVKIIIQVVM